MDLCCRANSLYLPLIPEERLLVLVAYLGVLFFNWWTCVALVYFAHKQLFAWSKLDRFLQCFVCFVSPAAAMRGRDHLARHLFAWAHPLAVLGALELPEDEFFAEVTARDAVYSMPFDKDSEFDDQLLATVNASHEDYTLALTRSLESRGYAFENLLAPPNIQDPETKSYCERCLHEYSQTNIACESCNGRLTKSL